ncbi:MAG: hypothetical protein A3D26_02285 [Candidatus Blackburnbacteria bacterium RIFCSPHIGHO2_02_FULL_44_20]|uniref:Uncharacterized protein n=1 Tax=Candidatus Blackburnbacteria bacterium RIFCSPHIGHO2_02_FULL_44_20 TaxID=1797516 RepID=A0A1G1V7B7_9BACT|nr:MAG: hypothetical protein A3D26_02285 [Candidatus Blackburnbacteria bacterium RIFCSPHIGHO2_02_FULL_44_20]OGY11461.1 MAG: hypothetical protein A3E16_02255 [Candidatus Blackburnbacteria bacterium RIFCSPHIGHO2_12_FULL_44_25]
MAATIQSRCQIAKSKNSPPTKIDRDTHRGRGGIFEAKLAEKETGVGVARAGVFLALYFDLD